MINQNQFKKISLSIFFISCPLAAMAPVEKKAKVDDALQNLTDQLHDAAESGNVEAVEPLIDAGADINARRGKFQFTPLHSAVQNGHEAVVKLLLENWARGDLPHPWGSPLHIAAQYGHEAITTLLLDFGENIEAASFTGAYPLHFAAQYGHLGVARILLERDPSIINYRDLNGGSALHLAALYGHEEIVRLLVDSGADLNGHSKTCCFRLDEDEYSLIREGDFTPLHFAAFYGHYAIAEFLLNRNADIAPQTDVSGLTPLNMAMMGEQEAIVKLLLDRGAVDYEEGFVLYRAIKTGNEAIVKLILDLAHYKEATVNLSMGGCVPVLHPAVATQSESIITLLLDRGADIEEKKSSGKTPLHRAVDKENESIINLLLDRKANLEAKDKSGKTPLLLAVMSKKHAIIKLLLDRGADPEVKDSDGDTPLHKAVKRALKAEQNALEEETVECANIIKLLVDKGVNRLTTDAHGHNALQIIACSPDKFEMTFKLLPFFIRLNLPIKDIAAQAQSRLKSVMLLFKRFGLPRDLAYLTLFVNRNAHYKESSLAFDAANMLLHEVSQKRKIKKGSLFTHTDCLNHALHLLYVHNVKLLDSVYEHKDTAREVKAFLAPKMRSENIIPLIRESFKKEWRSLIDAEPQIDVKMQQVKLS